MANNTALSMPGPILSDHVSSAFSIPTATLRHRYHDDPHFTGEVPYPAGKCRRHKDLEELKSLCSNAS